MMLFRNVKKWLMKNADGDTDNEVINNAELIEMYLDSIQEVSGTVELCTSELPPKQRKRNWSMSGWKTPLKWKLQTRKKSETHCNERMKLNDEINKFIVSSEVLTELHYWKSTGDGHETEGLAWKT